ncbi:MAG: FtsK/SpoIIIE domain-containing protein, partial [Verrucomicrobiota bacterium]
EGRRKHKLQTETMQMHRNHETGRATAEKTIIEFKTSLAQELEVLASLEKTARDSFKGYGKFVRLLSQSKEIPESDLAKDEYKLIAELDTLLTETREDLERFGKMLLPKLFKHRIALSLFTFCLIPLVPVLHYFDNNAFSYREAGMSAGAVFFLGFILHFLGKSQAEPRAVRIANAIGRARRLHDICYAKTDSRYSREVERVENELKKKSQWIEGEWKATLENAATAKGNFPQRVDDKFTRSFSSNEEQYRIKRDRLNRDHENAVAKLTGERDLKKTEWKNISEAKEAKFNADYRAQWQVIKAEWESKIGPLYATIGRVGPAAEKFFPSANAEFWKEWSSPEKFEQAAKFGRLDVDVEKLAGRIPQDEKLKLPGPIQFPLPLLLTYPQQGALLIETKESGRNEAIAALNQTILRLLSTAPPGKLSFTVIDPVGLGQNFSGIMHIADYAEHLINNRIWTQPGQIEQKLTDLNEHMEKVIQMYLRNEYATIAEYNEQAGNIAEKYHFLVVADFPSNFTDAAAKRLLSIATSGARCGVYTLIHWDHNHPAPLDFVPDELRKSSVTLQCKGNKFTLAGKLFPGTNLLLDTPPDADLVTEFIHKVGKSNRDSNRVEVPFSHVAPPAEELWTLETTSELRVPIGRTGATKLQYLSIGKGTRQHALLAGKTGSGKSTLFHVIITNLALWCSPDEVEFYLIDFKKGVEFKCYAEKKLPHARVVAIESDREFGLSVLQRVDDELKRRGDLFRKAGVQDLAGYKKGGGTESVPRSLLIIDEFQEFFVEDDRISQTASALLDRIVRQGRAFGIHVLLGSQTLGGAYTMARTTMGQMVIRIALQCNEADAYLIMDENNPAPRLLSRPGEGIYNDAAGNIQGNSPFQAVWLPDEVRDSYLDMVTERAKHSAIRYAGPIVFEGDAPADVRENSELKALLKAESVSPASSPRIWLGAPNSIKGPTEAVFHRQSGNNLLIVGQRDEAILAILSIGLISLASQYSIGSAQFILFDANPPGSAQRELLERIIAAIPHKITLVKQPDLSEAINGLASDLKARAESQDASRAPAIFLFIHGLQKFGRLRFEDDFGFSSDENTTANPAVQLNKLICEGPSFGIHVVATCDTYNNMNRFLSKKAFSEFEMRVLFQMSANDSASLIDNPKAGTLGMHRALFYNEQQGHLELFRPYSLPNGEWISQVAADLPKVLLNREV